MIQIFRNLVAVGRGVDNLGLKQELGPVEKDDVVYIRKLEDTDLVRSFFYRIF